MLVQYIQMRRSRITITLKQSTIDNVDRLIDHQKIRNRSHAIEYILDQYNIPTIKKAIILAGGVGRQLRPYTYEVPKSLLPVKGKPILEYIIQELKENYINEIILSTGYLGNKIQEYFGDGKKFGVHITYAEEKDPLQTGGAIAQVKKYVEGGPFLVIHGDIVTSLQFRDLIEFHQKEKSVVTAALTTVDKPIEFGQLALHGTKLVRFYQHTNNEEVKSNLVNCGIYVCEPTIFNYFPKNKNTFLFEDVIDGLISQKQVTGFVFEGQWFDVGNPKNYEQAIKHFNTK